MNEKKIALLLGYIKKHFVFKAVVSVCLAVIYCMFAYGGSGDAAVAYLALNYPAALNGQYLNGTRLNMYDILSEDTLQNAIDKAGLTNIITASELSDKLTISPRYSSSPTNAYIATEFEINLNMSGSIANVDSQGLLQMVCMAFVESFYGAHAYNQTVLNFSLDNTDDMDYDEIEKMLQTKIDLMSDYLNYRYKQAPDFYSADTGESFSSLRQRISDFANVAIENYNAYMLDNGVTKDLDKLRATIDYEQVLLNKSYDTNMAAYDVRIDAIKNYDSIQSAIVMIPTADEDGEFYMSKTKIGIDYLAEAANEAMSKAKDTKKTIDKNDSRLSQANATTQYSRTQAGERLDEMIDEIKASLYTFEQLVIATDDDYIREQTSESLIYRLRQPGYSELYAVKNTIMVMGVSFILLTAVVWTLQKRKTDKSRKASDANA